MANGVRSRNRALKEQEQLDDANRVLSKQFLYMNNSYLLLILCILLSDSNWPSSGQGKGWGSSAM